MKTLLRILLFCVPALVFAAPKLSPDDLLRDTLNSITCKSFTASVADGPALATALREALRAEPGGQAVNVLWRAKRDTPLPHGAQTFDFKDLGGMNLLASTCRQAGVHWGIRDAGVVIDTVPQLRTKFITVDPVLMSSVRIDSPVPVSNPPEPNPDGDLTGYLRNLLPTLWRGDFGPTMRYEPSITQLILTAAEEDFPILDDFIIKFNMSPRQVQITATWVAVPSGRVEAALTASPDAALSQTTMLKLFHGGEKRILYSQSVVTLSGINAVTESVDEIRYPTEYVEPWYMRKDGRSVTNALGGVVMPHDFETREIGAIMNATPTVHQDNETISLQLLPEVAELVDWIQYGHDVQASAGRPPRELAHIPQPVFRSNNLTTSITLRDGSTLALGGGRHPKTGEYIYCFLHAVLLDISGKPLR